MASADEQVVQALSGIGRVLGKKIVLLNPGDEYERAKLLLAQCGYQVDRQPATSPAARPAVFLIGAPQPQAPVYCGQQQQYGAPVYYEQQQQQPTYGLARCPSEQQLWSQYEAVDLNTLVYAHRAC